MAELDFCNEWLAIHDTMPGDEPRLRVTGTCCFKNNGWSAELRTHEGNPGTGTTKMLAVHVTKPSDVANEVLIEVPVSWEESTSATYTHVHIEATGDAEGTKILEVQEVT